MKSRERYQNGSLSSIGDAWWLRYYEHHADGGSPRVAVKVGTLEQFPTKRAARKEADRIMRGVNDSVTVVRFDDLCDLYKEKGMGHLREYTQEVYRSYLGSVRRAFADQRLDFLSTPRGIIHLEDWLNTLKTNTGRPVAASTRHKCKVMLSLLFRFAMKNGFLAIQENPVQLVDTLNRPNNTTPKRTRDVVTVDQYRKLLADDQLPEVCKVLLQVCTMTGLRSCEALGLRWTDVEFDAGKVYIVRSVKGRYEDDPKTLESKATVPLDADAAAVLEKWKKSGPPVNGWIFGSAITGRPLYGGGLQSHHLKPAGLRIGIKSLGWHNFRHTYRALGRQAGVSLEEQSMLMRHANIQQTAKYGNDGIDRADHLRAANQKIVSILRNGTNGQ